MPNPTRAQLISKLQRTKRDLRLSKREIRFLTKCLEDPPVPFQLYRLPQVSHLMGVHPRTIWRWMASENFPRPFKIGPSVIAWRADQLESWVRSRPKKESGEVEELAEFREMTESLEGMAQSLRRG
jgi:predicted DNA-binding transcriptional regulator AlpA